MTKVEQSPSQPSLRLHWALPGWRDDVVDCSGIDDGNSYGGDVEGDVGGGASDDTGATWT